MFSHEEAQRRDSASKQKKIFIIYTLSIEEMTKYYVQRHHDNRRRNRLHHLHNHFPINRREIFEEEAHYGIPEGHHENGIEREMHVEDSLFHRNVYTHHFDVNQWGKPPHYVSKKAYYHTGDYNRDDNRYV